MRLEKKKRPVGFAYMVDYQGLFFLLTIGFSTENWRTGICIVWEAKCLAPGTRDPESFTNHVL